ncbi:hypothetical protein HA402_007668 [Bradysia odoriphaga]|nr:hypothetical protein HA402_007668 [Bradysia odoriphaga]
MTTPLLEINVNNLFEEHTVAEIHQIHKKLQSDVEAKKEELRTMVGERYRDLLKAADTIGEMKNASQSVTDQIGQSDRNVSQFKRSTIARLQVRTTAVPNVGPTHQRFLRHCRANKIVDRIAGIDMDPD